MKSSKKKLNPESWLKKSWPLNNWSGSRLSGSDCYQLWRMIESPRLIFFTARSERVRRDLPFGSLPYSTAVIRRMYLAATVRLVQSSGDCSIRTFYLSSPCQQIKKSPEYHKIRKITLNHLKCIKSTRAAPGCWKRQQRVVFFQRCQTTWNHQNHLNHQHHFK